MSKTKAKSATVFPALEPGRKYYIGIQDWRPATTNQIYDRNFWRGAKLKKRDREIIAKTIWRIQQIDPARPIKRRVSIEIAYASPLRECDCDAFWKSTLDALVAAGALKDDKPSWCEQGTVTQTKSETGKTWTIITLEDL